MSRTKKGEEMSLFVPLIVAILALIIIMKSASYALSAIVNYSKLTGISEYFIGFFVVSIGTTLPEMCTAIFASLNNNGAISLGNVIGANVLDVTLIMGVTALFGRKILIKNKLSKANWITVAVMALPLLLGIDGRFGRIDGIILIAAFFVYIIILMEREKSIGKIK